MIKTYIDLVHLKKLASSCGCKYLIDVDADIKELSNSSQGDSFIWLVTRKGTLLQNKNRDLNPWVDRYKANVIRAYELVVETYDGLQITEISSDQALLELNAAA